MVCIFGNGFVENEVVQLYRDLVTQWQNEYVAVQKLPEYKNNYELRAVIDESYVAHINLIKTHLSSAELLQAFLEQNRNKFINRPGAYLVYGRTSYLTAMMRALAWVFR